MDEMEISRIKETELYRRIQMSEGRTWQEVLLEEQKSISGFWPSCGDLDSQMRAMGMTLAFSHRPNRDAAKLLSEFFFENCH